MLVKVMEAKTSVAEIWQSLKSQVASPRNQGRNARMDWNAFSQKDDTRGPTSGAAVPAPFILGIGGHRCADPADLRSAARAVLHNLQEERENQKQSAAKSENPRHLRTHCDESPDILHKLEENRDLNQSTVKWNPASTGSSFDEVVMTQDLESGQEQEPCTVKPERSPHGKRDQNLDEKQNHELVDEDKERTYKSLPPPDGSSPYVGRGMPASFIAGGEHVEEQVSDSELETAEEMKERSNDSLDTHVSVIHDWDHESCPFQDGRGPKSATDEELLKIINKDANCLHDSRIDVRYEALQSLSRALLGDFVGEVRHQYAKRSSDQEHEQQAQAVDFNAGLFENTEKYVWCVEEIVIKALLKTFGDSSERCRYLSVSIILSLLQSVPRSVVSLLPYILPVISSRLPIKSLPTEDPASKVEVIVVEKSEEVRLLLLELLHGLLKKARSMIHPFASDVATILTAASCDSYPEVLTETFAALTLFGETCGHKLKPVAKQLISVVSRSLAHNRHSVRVAAVRAIHRLVLCGAHESIYDLTAYRDPNVIPIRAFYHPDPKTQYLALLAGDRSIQVREQLLKTVASWLCELDERKEHECRLVPYILSGFTDTSPDIRDLAFQLMEKIGRQYEAENENEVSDIQVYMPEDIDNLGMVAGKPLPKAFKFRPCLGARILVRSCVSVMLHALSGDLEAWTSGTKALAADFLYTMLLFAEEHITMHLQSVVILLMKAFDDPQIEEKISECAQVIGFFVDPAAYLMVLLPRITGEFNSDMSVQQLLQALKVLEKIMEGTPHPRLTKHVPQLCSVLSESDLMSSIQFEVNQSIVAQARMMVKAWTTECSNETISLLWILLNTAAAMDFCGRPAPEAEAGLHALAMSSGMGSREALVAAHADTVLDLLPHPQFWAMRSLHVHVFSRLLGIALFLPPATQQRIFRLLKWFGLGSSNIEIKLRLVHAIKDMMITTQQNEKENKIGPATTMLPELEEGIVEVLEYFFIPFMEQLQESHKGGTLQEPIFVALSHIMHHHSINIPRPLITRICEFQGFLKRELEHEWHDRLEKTPSLKKHIG